MESKQPTTNQPGRKAGTAQDSAPISLRDIEKLLNRPVSTGVRTVLQHVGAVITITITGAGISGSVAIEKEQNSTFAVNDLSRMQAVRAQVLDVLKTQAKYLRNGEAIGLIERMLTGLKSGAIPNVVNNIAAEDIAATIRVSLTSASASVFRDYVVMIDIVKKNIITMRTWPVTVYKDYLELVVSRILSAIMDQATYTLLGHERLAIVRDRVVSAALIPMALYRVFTNATFEKQSAEDLLFPADLRKGPTLSFAEVSNDNFREANMQYISHALNYLIRTSVDEFFDFFEANMPLTEKTTILWRVPRPADLFRQIVPKKASGKFTSLLSAVNRQPSSGARLQRVLDIIILFTELECPVDDLANLHKEILDSPDGFIAGITPFWMYIQEHPETAVDRIINARHLRGAGIPGALTSSLSLTNAADIIIHLNLVDLLGVAIPQADPAVPVPGAAAGAIQAGPPAVARIYDDVFGAVLRQTPPLFAASEITERSLETVLANLGWEEQCPARDALQEVVGTTSETSRGGDGGIIYRSTRSILARISAEEIGLVKTKSLARLLGTFSSETMQNYAAELVLAQLDTDIFSAGTAQEAKGDDADASDFNF